jgi:hypothetical protein
MGIIIYLASRDKGTQHNLNPINEKHDKLKPKTTIRPNIITPETLANYLRTFTWDNDYKQFKLGLTILFCYTSKPLWLINTAFCY